MLIFSSNDPTVVHDCEDECPACDVTVTGAAWGRGDVRTGFTADRCVAYELQTLMAAGVRTVCSCCGHGSPEQAYIVVDPQDAEKMADMGYEPCDMPHEHCGRCGVAYRARLTIGEIPDEGGRNDGMYDIELVTTDKATVCGAASLKMLLKYYGHDVDLDTLIEACGVGVGGCTAKDLLRVGRAYGLGNDFAAWQEDAADVLRQDRPAILWWRYNHFVVYAGNNAEGEPVICNPSRGKYPIDAGTFKTLFSGVALCVGRPMDTMADDYFGENEPEPDYFDE